MLTALENLPSEQAEKVLSALMKTLLPDASERSKAQQLEALTALEREILTEVAARLSIKGPLPSRENVSAVLELLSRELSDVALSTANPEELQARTFDKELSAQPSVTRHRKPRVFISSSSEGLAYAHAMMKALGSYAEVELWSERAVDAGETFAESLLRALARFDFATFLLTADDFVSIRGRQSSLSSNVAFELGLFVGRLGPNRTFFVVPRQDSAFRIPSDLSGLLTLTYDPRESNFSFASVSQHVIEQVRRLGPIESKVPASKETR